MRWTQQKNHAQIDLPQPRHRILPRGPSIIMDGRHLGDPAGAEDVDDVLHVLVETGDVR
jgi:hypothetical protein